MVLKMGYNIIMKILVKAILLIILLCSCCKPHIKIRPEYKGVDPILGSLVDEYIDLANQNGIVFDNKVTIGFKDIGNGTIVGLCTFGGWFREIDIDKDYWNKTGSLSHLVLVWHELTHCYCSRIHDYGEGKIYSNKEWIFGTRDAPGYYSDGCPITIMYPQVLDDTCTESHYSDYIKEMFDRCIPY